MTLPSSVCALFAALAIILLALVAARHVRDNDYFVGGCDAFGYERMARVIRQAHEAGAPADYGFHDEQTRFLIDQFKASGLAVGRWDEAVTTHAHHYFPGTDQIGPQYPPGTSWVLSLFPAGNDVRALDLWTIWFLVAGSGGLLAWSAWRGLTLASFLVAGAAAALLAPYGWTESESYSISATIGPLFVGTLLAWAATRVHDRRAAAALGVGAGLCFGLLIQVRLASALLAPAAALLFVPRRSWLLLPGYAAGVVLGGIVQVLLHDRAITGSFLGTTYNKGDTVQALDHLATDLRFYFGRYPYDSGLLHVAALGVIILLWLAVVSATRPPGAALGWRRWLVNHWGLLAAPACAVGLTLAYFLTHTVTVYYYLVPATLLTCLLLALLGITLEEHWQKEAGHFVDAWKPRAIAMGVAAVVALVSLATSHRFMYHQARNAWEGHQQPSPPFNVPAPMLDPRAWIWADYFSSSIVYYTGHPSFKIPFSGLDMRRLMYGWVQARGEPQYLVADSGYMKSFVDEARAEGWRLTPIGEIRDRVCYRMDRP